MRSGVEGSITIPIRIIITLFLCLAWASACSGSKTEPVGSQSVSSAAVPAEYGKGEAAFNKYKWLVDNGAFDKADLGVGFADANSAFGAGKAAMYFMGSWFLQYDAVKNAKFEPGVFLFPRDDGKQIVPFSVGGGIHLSALRQFGHDPG